MSDVLFRKMYFVLCPWNVRQDGLQPQSMISKTLCEMLLLAGFELKRAPSVMSIDFMLQVQNAARVFEFEKIHAVLKGFLDVEDAMERTAIYKKELSEQSSLDDFEYRDDVHAARLRVLSLFKLDGNELTEVKELALDSYNNFFMRTAAKAFDLGNIDVCLEYLKKIESPASKEVMDLRTELIVRTIHTIEDPVERDGYLKLAFDHFQAYTGSYTDLKEQQAKYYAYNGLLKSLVGSKWSRNSFPLKDDATSLFEKSLRKHSFSKIHEWYGNFLEKTYITKRLEGQTSNQKTAKDAVQQLIFACKYKDKFEAQVPLAKVIGLLLYGYVELDYIMVHNIYCLPPDYWLPLLPQLLEIAGSSTKRNLHPLVETIGNEFPQDLFFALRELRSQTEEWPETFSKELRGTIRKIHEKHFKLLFTLVKIGEELSNLKKSLLDDTLYQLHSIKASVCNLAYECSVRCGAEPQSLHVQNLLEATLQEGLKKEIVKILKMKANLDRPLIQELKQLSEAVGLSEESDVLQRIDMLHIRYSVWKLLRKLLTILTSIINVCKKSKKVQIKSLHNYCAFLSTFHLYEIEVGLFRNWLSKGQNCVQIAKFLPRLEILQRQGTYTCRICILGSDGQEYSYLVVPVMHLSQNEHRVFQLFYFLNPILAKGKTLTQFNIPSICPFPKICLTEDNKKFNSYLSIFELCHLKLQHNPVVIHYRLFEYYRKNQNTNLMNDESIRCKVFNDVQQVVPKTMLKDWVRHNCKNATEFLLFRKKFSREIALVAFAKYCFRLSLQTPDNLFIDKTTGVLTSFGLKFDLKPKLKHSQSLISESGNCIWPPLQLTPNILELTSSSGMDGSVVFAMAAIARCFNTNNDAINAMLNILVFKELEEGEMARNNSVTAFDDHLFKETKTLIEEIGGMIKECVEHGTFKALHTLVSDSFQVKNMSLSNPWYFPWY